MFLYNPGNADIPPSKAQSGSEKGHTYLRNGMNIENPQTYHNAAEPLHAYHILLFSLMGQ